jgi:peptidoglycan/LPS O-acetylase OafA/YrhL
MLDTPFAVPGRVAKYGLLVAMERVLVLIAGSTFMLQMFYPTLTVINIPSWSLSVESVFYLSFPLLGPLVWKLQRRGLLLSGLIPLFASIGLHWRAFQFRPDTVPALDLPPTQRSLRSESSWHDGRC